jgi:hypothetical protein
MYQGQCIKCPKGSTFNGTNCVKKTYVNAVKKQGTKSSATESESSEESSTTRRSSSASSSSEEEG